MDLMGSSPKKAEPKSKVVVVTPAPAPTSTRISTRGKPAKQLGWEEWEDKTARILSKYTTDQRVAVSANFLEDEQEQKANKPVDQASARMAELEAENEDSAQAKSFMTQKEYIAHIEEQHTRLKSSWAQNERVVALKIAIQCAKLLGDTSVPVFYPSMYVLLTSVLDTFGNLVYDRLLKNGREITKGKYTALPDTFRAVDVCANSKEMCRNWFFKTACIRELMPRLYIDLALIKSYRFLHDDTYAAVLNRVSKSIRGVGDPLAATYARAYLTRKINDVTNSYYQDKGVHRAPPDSYKNSLLEAFDDFMFTFRHLEASEYKEVTAVSSGKITKDKYVDLYSPAIEWLVQNVGFCSSEELFFAILQQ